ncbi:hypothetical protein ISN45_Aa06g018650 [Arabidopsis thaliana x Arabidopsis arenosa]|uniref:Low-density receptor-like protein n=1 Tax=Arabidopsis thaliana x Arabidopsis arenosa TaxID=1240361 RepID=A0A8T1YYL6_9BRAS|nr:hypothetical protein ISN45_Aa06g018650 [Arabidopsis thaliana x Arabidopsis arenosa]
MASPSSSSPKTRIWFRTVILISLMVVLFYVGRPLYWKISATIHDIRHNKQSVREGISQIVHEAQRSVGWYHDESDSGFREGHYKKSGVAVSRRLLFAGYQ